MPVITRRQPLLDLRGKTASLALSDTISLQSPDDNKIKSQFWLVTEDYSYSVPQKEMDFPSPHETCHQLKAKSKSRSNLRLATQSTLHARYQSSEEEVSPSPDDYNTSSADESSLDESHKKSTATPKNKETTDTLPELDSDTDADSDSDYDSAPSTPPALATRLTFTYAGRPRLISIAALAPMQKRKRSPPPPMSFHSSSIINPNYAFSSAHPSPISTASAYHSAPTSPPPRAAKRPMPSPAPKAIAPPSMWLPQECDDEQAGFSEGEEVPVFGHSRQTQQGRFSPHDDDLETLVEPESQSPGELYFPPALELSPTPTTYAEYDPYSLDPPRLSGSGEYVRAGRKYSAFGAGAGYAGSSGSVNSGGKGKGWRGLGMSFGLGRRGNGFEVGMERGRVREEGLGGAFVFED